MKVLDLRCSHGHGFEGWFASEADYLDQRERGILVCPMCNDAQVTKTLSAPRLNLRSSGTQTTQTNEVETTPNAAPSPSPGLPALSDLANALTSDEGRQQLLKTWLEVSRKLVNNSEDVGKRFADEARKIHYGDAEERSIHGQASREEVRDLLDEGVEIMPLILPESAKEPLQ